MVISAHKTLPAVSQAAVVLARTTASGGLLDAGRLDRAVEATATTSPRGDPRQHRRRSRAAGALGPGARREARSAGRRRPRPAACRSPACACRGAPADGSAGGGGQARRAARRHRRPRGVVEATCSPRASPWSSRTATRSWRRDLRGRRRDRGRLRRRAGRRVERHRARPARWSPLPPGRCGPSRCSIPVPPSSRGPRQCRPAPRSGGSSAELVGALPARRARAGARRADHGRGALVTALGAGRRGTDRLRGRSHAGHAAGRCPAPECCCTMTPWRADRSCGPCPLPGGGPPRAVTTSSHPSGRPVPGGRSCVSSS